MNRRSRKQALICEINITPFTDVILVLLVIFMITTPLMYQADSKHIKVNLPLAKHVSPSASAQKAESVTITLSSEGPMYLDGAIITLKELESQLSMTAKTNPDINIFIQVDRLVAFKNVVRVLDVLNGLGLERLQIAAEEEK